MKKILVKCKGVLLGTLVVVCLCSCAKDTAYYVEEETTVSEVEVSEQSEVQKQEDAQSIKPDIYVYVCGQVQAPGVYVLPEGSRVCDAFKMAGGLTAEAASDYWNQAQILKDGEMIYVPTAEEAGNRHFNNESDTDDSSKVNINTASKEELMTIPGIGEAKALAILAYRQENGPFSSIEELKNVEGIKDGVFSKMKEYIEVN